jgi:hypothetical protein
MGATAVLAVALDHVADGNVVHHPRFAHNDGLRAGLAVAAHERNVGARRSSRSH